MSVKLNGANLVIIGDSPAERKIGKIYKELIGEFAAKFGEKTITTLVVERKGDTVNVALSIRQEGAAKSWDVVVEREFDLSQKPPTLNNTFLSVDETLQKQGLGTLVNRVGVKALAAIGGSRVSITANLDAGGYVWLHKGFWPDGGKPALDKLVEASALALPLKEKWLSLGEAEAVALALSPAFAEYEKAFLGSKWSGVADISNPAVRAALTGVNDLPDVPFGATANEIYRDAAIRNQIGVRRYSQGLTRRISSALEQADAELAAKLRERLATFAGSRVDVTSQRWKALLADIQKSRREVLGGVEATAQRELQELSTQEATRELNMLQTAVPIEISFAAVAAPQLEAIVESKPFQGKLLADWFSGLKVGDASRLTQALQLGMLEGEPIDSIVRRIVGTRANQYTDGILSITRRDATAIVRTAVNHVSNEARGAVWEANDDIISAKVWTATLDGRTTVLCASRDGKGVPVGDNPLPEGVEPLTPPNATPPAHMNCRSVMVALIDGLGLIGDRPVVVDTRTRKQREVDFRALAKESGKTIQEIRAEWAARVVGRVPSTTTYEQFLRRQSSKFQEEVLGVTKAQLFRNGGLRLDQFVDRAGNELTLEELAKTAPEAFKRIH